MKINSYQLLLVLYCITPNCAQGNSNFLYLQEKKRLSAENTDWRDLKITPVDNYQGEENRIILLSLVRSNKEGKIGFLSAENRVCVALSRARDGLYIVGNMDNLTASSSIWPKIKEQLEENNALGKFTLIIL